MKKYFRFCLCIFVAISFSNCKKNNETENDVITASEDIGTDSLTYEQDSIIMENSAPNPALSDLIALDGSNLQDWIDSVIPYWNDTLNNLKLNSNLSPSEKKELLINQVVSQAEKLAAMKSNYDSGQVLPNRPFCPPQWGIAYSYGQKDFSERNVPPGKEASDLHKRDSVRGLDCSGFIYNIFKRAGLDQLRTFSAINFPDKFKSAVNSGNFSELKLVNKGFLMPQDFQNGDIVIWDSHIGIIVFKDMNGSFLFYNSNGVRDPQERKKNGVVIRTADQDQVLNQGLRRGVHPITWDSTTIFFGSGYNIYRIEPINDRIPSLLAGIWSFEPTVLSDPSTFANCNLDDYIRFKNLYFCDWVDGGIQCAMGEGNIDYYNNIRWKLKNNQTVLQMGTDDFQITSFSDSIMVLNTSLILKHIQ